MSVSYTEDDIKYTATVVYSDIFLKMILFDVLIVFPNYNFLSSLVAPL